MLYVIKVKDEFRIVDRANSYIYRGSREECEAWLQSKPASPEEAKARQLKFLKESRRGQGWRKGKKGVLTSQPK
ncbi:MAG: hypothetical protein AAF798_21290 [Bacteroidota bacterium]